MCQGFQWVPNTSQPSTIYQDFQMVPYISQHAAVCQGFQLLPYNNQPSIICQSIQWVPFTNQPSTICPDFQWMPNASLHSTIFQGFQPVQGSVDGSEWFQTFQPACLPTMDAFENPFVFQHIEMNKIQPYVAIPKPGIPIPNPAIPIPNHVPRHVHSNQEESRYIRRSLAISIEKAQTTTTVESKVTKKPILQYCEKDPLHTNINKCGEITRPIIHHSLPENDEVTAFTKDILVNNCSSTLAFAKPTESKTSAISDNSYMTMDAFPELEYYETYERKVQRKPILQYLEKDLLHSSPLKFGEIAGPIINFCLQDNDDTTAFAKDNLVNRSDTSIPLYQSRSSETLTEMCALTKSLIDVVKNTRVTVENNYKLSKGISKCLCEPTAHCHVTMESVDSAIVFQSNFDQPGAFETVQNNIPTSDDKKNNVLTSESKNNVDDDDDDGKESSAIYLDEFFDDKRYVYGKSLIKRSPNEREARYTVKNDHQLSDGFVEFMYEIANPCFSHLAAQTGGSNKTDKKPINVQDKTCSDCNLSELVDEVVDDLLYASPTNTADTSNMITDEVAPLIDSQTDELIAMDAKTRSSKLSKQDTTSQTTDLHVAAVHQTADAATYEDDLQLQLDVTKSMPKLRASHAEEINSVDTKILATCSTVANNLFSTSELPECGRERNVFKYLESYMSGFRSATYTTSKEYGTNDITKTKPITETSETTVVERKSSEITKPDNITDVPTEQVVDLHPLQSFFSEIQGVSNTISVLGRITSCPIKPTVCVSEAMAGIDYWDNHCSTGTGQFDGDLLSSCFKTDVKHGSNDGNLLKNPNTVDSQHHNIPATNLTVKQQQVQEKARGQDWSGLFTSCKLPSYRQKRKIDEPVLKEGRIARPPKLLRL